jgi:SAM-dependent methyltransferase
MNLREIVTRNQDLQPWVEGERIPWDDPAFSQRILREHLTQDHDAASRRKVKIKKHADWIHRQILGGHPTRILDLGCGPGLYAAPFTKLGHTYTGIDFSPACIDFARENAPAGCAYQLGDLRSVDYGHGYGLVLYIFGALNLVPQTDARSILGKIYAALNPGGLVLLEASSLEAVDQIGNQPSMWYTAESSLFSDAPHLCLMENFWDEDQAIATERFYIVDAATGEVTRHAASTQGYDEGQIESLLRETGFGEVTFYPSLTGQIEGELNDFLVVTATRPAN